MARSGVGHSPAPFSWLANGGLDRRSAPPQSVFMVSCYTAGGFAEAEQRALRFEAEQKLEKARDAFDLALRLNPSAQSAAEGRARVAIGLKDEDAAKHCSRALAFHDDSPDRQLRMILTVAVELGRAAIPLLERFLARRPDNVAAHEYLAELRAESGDETGFADSYTDALRQLGPHKPLLLSYWNTLRRAGQLERSLDSMDGHRATFAGDRDFQLLELNVLNQAGLHVRAGQLVSELDDRPDAQLARAQHYFQVREPDAAARLLEAVTSTAAEPLAVSAWALLELAWRTTGDPRHHWLAGQAGLYGCRELDLDDAQLSTVAAALRALHGARSQPLGQSVKGGTQTPGQLFSRGEPEVTLLRDSLVNAIRDFVDDLPAFDAKHPLLKHRHDGLAFGPSWSVRLRDGGYHAAHVHPGGIMSSACYVALPDDFSTGEDRSGWLEIGRPPPELGMDLSPLATFEPRPGRLVLFPSFLFHGTRPFAGGERLTAAFDLVPVAADR